MADNVSINIVYKRCLHYMHHNEVVCTLVRLLNYHLILSRWIRRCGRPRRRLHDSRRPDAVQQSAGQRLDADEHRPAT